MITCAVTGASDTVGRHPAIPVTPEQIANAALEAAEAGAGPPSRVTRPTGITPGNSDIGRRIRRPERLCARTVSTSIRNGSITTDT